MKVFHYTIGLKLESIFNDGFLHTSPLKPNYGEKPLVWLSSNPNYELTARKALILKGQSCIATVIDMQNYAGGVFRFVFDIPSEQLANWQTIRNKCGISSAIRRRCLERAKLVGANETEWYGVVDRNLSIDSARLEKCIEVKENGELVWEEVSRNLDAVESTNSISRNFNQMNSNINLDTAWQVAR